MSNHMDEEQAPPNDKEAGFEEVERVNTQSTLAEVDIDNKKAYKGDESDGKANWTFGNWVAAALLAMLYTGSQLVLYFVGASLQYIAVGIGAPNVVGWLPVANTLAIAAVCPFVGYLQDLFGKRYISIFGGILLCIGCAVLGSANTLGQAVTGMALAGAGAGIGELTGLAGLAETVAVKHRGYSIAILTAFVVPFAPYVLYSEEFSLHDSWRWAGWIPLIYNGVTTIGLILFYFPHSHARAEGIPWRRVISRIDFVGGFLSIVGLTLFLVALQAGGYTHSWKSAYVLCTLLIGLALIAAWVAWEALFAKHPMVPPELFRGQRVVGLAFVVAAVAGMNFFSVLNFWPLTIETVWNPSIIRVGMRGLAGALGTVAGAILFNSLLSVWPARCGLILFVAATILTAFGGALSDMSPYNQVQSVAFGVLALFGIGGLIVPSASTAMIAAPDALITTCAALSLSVRAVGGSIGYSIYYNVFRQKLTKNLPLLIGEYAVEAGLPTSEVLDFVEAFVTDPASVVNLPRVTPQIIEAATLGYQTAYANSLHYVWWISIPFGVLAMVAAILIPNTARFQTNRIAVKL